MKKTDYKHHIFLSYAHKDVDIMIPVRNYLESKEFKVWTDENLKPGTPEWVRAIENALDDCGCMVVIFTKNAQISKWVQREITYADQNEMRIFPFIVSGDPQKSIIVNSTQYIDARDFDTAAPKLLHAIHDHLDLTPIIQPDAEYNIVILGKDSFAPDTLNKYDNLNKRAKQVLLYISEHKTKYDRSPTVRDIMENVGLKSTDTVHYHIQRLRNAGFLEQDEKLARSTSIVRPVAKYDIFLSFSLADEEIAYQIQKHLDSKDLRVCITEGVGPAFTRLTRIQEEIRNSRFMVSVLSPLAKHSTKVLTHLICAQETQTAIIPLLVNGSPIDSIPTMLPSESQFYDLRDISAIVLNEFSNALLRYLGRLI